MKTVVHTVNLSGSDEFTVHISRDGKLSADAVFASGDKKSNRRNAIEHARQLAFELRCKHAMNHGIRRERWREFLQMGRGNDGMDVRVGVTPKTDPAS